MTPCPQIPRVHAFYDGELPAEQAALVQAHLRTCAICSEELRSLQNLSQQIRDLAPQSDTQTLAAIRMHVHRNLPSPMLRTAWRLTAAAAVVMALCITKISLDPNTTPSRATPSSWEEAATLAGEPQLALANTDESQQAQWMIDELSAPGSAAPGNITPANALPENAATDRRSTR